MHNYISDETVNKVISFYLHGFLEYVRYDGFIHPVATLQSSLHQLCD